MEASGAAERLTGIDGALQAVADPASCRGGPGNEQASRLFFDAATAAHLRAELVGPESGVFGLTATSASAAPVYHAASYGLTDNTLRAYESLRGLSLAVQQVDPALALRSTASAYGLAVDVASDARDYDYLRAKTYDRLPSEAQASLPVSLQGVAPGDLTPNPILDARTAVGGHHTQRWCDGARAAWGISLNPARARSSGLPCKAAAHHRCVRGDRGRQKF